MKLYNSATRTKEEFVPNHPDIVKMYTCGPTVYHYAHIGNLRSYIMEDVLEKYLRYAGYNVKRVMNITDVGHLSSDADTAAADTAADDADKYSGGHEYEYHGDDVLVADALAHKLKLFVKAQGAVLKTGDEQRDQERHDDGYLVEAHADLQHVHENYAETEIYDQKYAYGQKRDSVAFFHAFSSVCENAPVLLLRTGAMRIYCAFFL